MGGRRSAQPTPIVERVAAKVFVHAEPADAARTVPAGRWWRSAAKDRLVAAAAGPAAFRDAAPHQRRYRRHRFPPHGGKITSPDAVPAFEQVARILIPVVVVKGVL